MRISLIVSTYNRPEYVACFLASLAWQRRMPDELVIADDGSAPGTWDRICTMAKASPVPAVCVRQEDCGFRLAAARNMGVRASHGDYLIFSDSDMLLGPELVAVHEQHAREGYFLIGNRGELDEKQTRHIAASPEAPLPFETLWQTAERRHIAVSRWRYRRHALQRRLGWASPHKPQIMGAHFSLGRDALDKVNGFDEMFTGWGYEDDDLSRRLYMAGLHSRSVMHAARALHLWHPAAAAGVSRETLPNRAYFKRTGVPASCSHGLIRQASSQGHIS